jgi:hypothetical protein
MIYDLTKNNVCISGVNGDFGPLASYNPSALGASCLCFRRGPKSPPSRP